MLKVALVIKNKIWITNFSPCCRGLIRFSPYPTWRHGWVLTWFLSSQLLWIGHFEDEKKSEKNRKNSCHVLQSMKAHTHTRELELLWCQTLGQCANERFSFFVRFLIYRKRYIQYNSITNMAIETIWCEQYISDNNLCLCDFRTEWNVHWILMNCVLVCAFLSLSDKLWMWMNDLISGRILVAIDKMGKTKKRRNVPHHIRLSVGTTVCHTLVSRLGALMINMDTSSGFPMWCVIRNWIEFEWDL